MSFNVVLIAIQFCSENKINLGICMFIFFKKYFLYFLNNQGNGPMPFKNTV